MNVGLMAKFMLGSGCDSINLVLKEIVVPSGVLAIDQGTCFEVSTVLYPSFMFLVIASILANLVSKVVTSLTETCVCEREGLKNDVEGGEKYSIVAQSLGESFCFLNHAKDSLQQFPNNYF